MPAMPAALRQSNKTTRFCSASVYALDSGWWFGARLDGGSAAHVRSNWMAGAAAVSAAAGCGATSLPSSLLVDARIIDSGAGSGLKTARDPESSTSNFSNTGTVGAGWTGCPGGTTATSAGVGDVDSSPVVAVFPSSALTEGVGVASSSEGNKPGVQLFG